jgi:two-component system response regulator RegA
VADGEASVLIVEDDERLRTRLARALRDRGYDVRVAEDAATAARLANLESPELAVVDLRLPDGSGLDVLRMLKRVDTATKVVVLTGYGSIATAIEAMRLGATHYVTKPADVDDILAGFARAELSADAPVAPPSAPPVEAPSLARTEREHIERVLADHHGNITHAARALGLHRRTLQRKLSKLPTPR